jgi:ABC-type dipeptide/oligopeptide/nickel transport system permease component
VHRLVIRLLDALVLLWLVTTLTFALIHLAPGDPATLLVAPTATADEVARQRARFGLDASLPAQYVQWLSALLQGDLGTSLVSDRPVRALIAEALPLSLMLGGASLTLSFLIGITVGGWALRASSPLIRRVGGQHDRVCGAGFRFALAHRARNVSASAIGAPAWLRLPAFGVESPGGLATGVDRWRDIARHALLPLLVLVLPGAAGVARYARQAMRDAMRAPHVTAARARGLPRRRVERR